MYVNNLWFFDILQASCRLSYVLTCVVSHPCCQVYPTQTVYVFQQDGVQLELTVSPCGWGSWFKDGLYDISLVCPVLNTRFVTSGFCPDLPNNLPHLQSVRHWWKVSFCAAVLWQHCWGQYMCVCVCVCESVSVSGEHVMGVCVEVVVWACDGSVWACDGCVCGGCGVSMWWCVVSMWWVCVEGVVSMWWMCV